MRAFVLAGLIVAAGLPNVAAAQAAPSAPAAAPAATGQHYSIKETDIGTLLDDPAARAIVDKYLPGFSANEQIEMARSMTFPQIQAYAADTLTDAKLAAIDADLAKLPVKPKAAK